LLWPFAFPFPLPPELLWAGGDAGSSGVVVVSSDVLVSAVVVEGVVRLVDVCCGVDCSPAGPVTPD
jgi:hypothetical protein